MNEFKFTKEDKEMRFYIPGYENPVILNLETKEAISPVGNVIKSLQGYFSNIDARTVLAGSPSPEYANFLKWFIDYYKLHHGPQLTNCGTIINKLCQQYEYNSKLLNRMEQFYVSYKFETNHRNLYSNGLSWCMQYLSNKTLHLIAEIDKNHNFNINHNLRYQDIGLHIKSWNEAVAIISKAWDMKPDEKGVYTYDRLEKQMGIFINTIIQKYYNKDIFMLEFIINNAFYHLPKIFALHTNTDSYILIEKLFEYWQNERIDAGETLNLLTDYWSMQLEMKSCNFTKYPKYLKTVHDVVTFNYKSTQFSDKQKEQFIANIRKNFDYIGRKYCVLTPNNIEDIRKEGSSLNHCVLSYVKKCIITSDHQIVFLRKNDNIDELETPLVTLHIYKNAIVHARGYNNRLPDTDEINAIVEYCSIKKLELIDNDIKVK